MDSLEYIDSYFSGGFPPEEVSRFEKRIQEDPVFAEEVAFYLGARGVAREAGVDERKTRFRELYQSRPAPVRRMPSQTWFRVAVAAAIVLVIGLVWLLFLRPADPTRLAERYIRDNLTVLPVKMGRADGVQTGLGLYNYGDFPGALRQFNDELRLDSLNPAALLYAGIVSLRMENYDKALDFFVSLSNHTDPHVNPALFYEALTLMRRGRVGDADKAKQLLMRIVREDLDKRLDAQELLGKL